MISWSVVMVDGCNDVEPALCTFLTIIVVDGLVGLIIFATC